MWMLQSENHLTLEGALGWLHQAGAMPLALESCPSVPSHSLYLLLLQVGSNGDLDLYGCPKLTSIEEARNAPSGTKFKLFRLGSD